MINTPINQLRHTSDVYFNRYCVKLPPGVTFDQLFEPMFWSAHTKRLNLNDVIRVRAADGSFDVELTVTGLMAAGAVVEMMKPYHAADLAAHLALQQAVEEMRPAVIE